MIRPRYFVMVISRSGELFAITSADGAVLLFDTEAVASAAIPADVLPQSSDWDIYPWPKANGE